MNTLEVIRLINRLVDDVRRVKVGVEIVRIKN